MTRSSRRSRPRTTVGSLDRSSRFLVIGDTHGNFRFLEEACKVAVAEGVSWMLQVGDWGFVFPTGDRSSAQKIEMVNTLLDKYDLDLDWFDGNHEGYGQLELLGVHPDVEEPVQMSERIRYLPRAHRWRTGDIRFMVVGGAYSIDRKWRTLNSGYWEQETITDEQVKRSIAGGKVDVMFTHDAPYGVTALETMLAKNSHYWANMMSKREWWRAEQASKENRRQVARIVKATMPKMLIHGHYHHLYADTFSYPIENPYPMYDVLLMGATWVLGLDCDASGSKALWVFDPDSFDDVL